MKKVYFDKTEEQFILITNVLEKYCVPYKKKIHKTRGMFYEDVKYDVIIDLTLEKTMTLKDGTKISPYNFIIGKINEIYHLYNSYKQTAVEHPKTIQEKQKELNLHRVEQELYEAQNKLMSKEIEDSATNKKITWKDRFKNILIDLFATNETINNNKQSDESIIPLLNPMNILDGIGITGLTRDVGEIIKFKDLPMEVKNILCSQYPKELLESDKCIIRKNNNSISVMIAGN